MISGDVLKYRKGLLIPKRYETRLTASSPFPLTPPSGGKPISIAVQNCYGRSRFEGYLGNGGLEYIAVDWYNIPVTEWEADTMETYPNGVGYVDGVYSAKEDMRVPVADLGFLLSDMTYDAVHVHNGNFFRLEDHLDRWERSIEKRRFTTLGHDRDGVCEIVTECVRRAELRAAMVYMVATRGEATDGLKDLRTCRNRLLAWAVPYYGVIAEDKMEDGIDIIVSDVLRTPPESIDPTVKNFARIDFSDALLQAYDKGAEHAVLLDRDGNVTEGRGWNIFALHGGALVSPDSGVLEGISRRTVIELCRNTNIKAELGQLKADDLRDADEVFMTSTAGGIMPVRKIDDRVIGTGTRGPVTTRLTDMYWELHEDPDYLTPIDYH
jgi:branched-chain amino acid aminotransferase